MKITATNRDAIPHSLTVGTLNVAAGATSSVLGATAQQAAQEISRSSRLFCVSVQEDPSDYPLWYAFMTAAADPAPSAKTATGQGLVISSTQATSTPITVAEPVGLELYDDAACTIPSKYATFNLTATTGTITAPPAGAYNAVEAVTNASGVLAVTVDIPASGPTLPYTVYLKAFSLGAGVVVPSTPSTHILDTTQTHTIHFT